MPAPGVLDKPSVPAAAPPAPRPPASAPSFPAPRMVVTAMTLAALVPLSGDAARATEPDRMSCTHGDTRATHRFPADWTGEVFVRFSLPYSGSTAAVPVKVKIAWGPWRSETTAEALSGDTGGTMLLYRKLDGAERPNYDTVFVTDTKVCAEFGTAKDLPYSVPKLTIHLLRWTWSLDVI